MIWDGDEGCEHEWGEKHIIVTGNYPSIKSTLCSPGEKEPGKAAIDYGQKIKNNSSRGQFCLHCSAWRGQLGLEPTIDLYLKHLMQIMDECKRVLRDDGVMFINLGDSYAGSGQGGGDTGFSKERYRVELLHYKTNAPKRPSQNCDVPQKSLCLIPYRFAIEMINCGWLCRNVIIWKKPNCMPSSVKDRFTVDFEPVFFFVKSKKYWFEQQYDEMSVNSSFKSKGDGLTPYAIATGNQNLGKGSRGDPNIGRNRRCVWTIPTQPYPESHFACVDDETECLTPMGWLKYQALQIGQPIAAYDMEKERAVWTSIQDVKFYKVKDQEMIKVLGRAIDMLITPNHRCVIKRRSNKTKQWNKSNIVEAKDLRVSHKIIVAPAWGDFPKCRLHKDLISLIGWYITEGNAGTDNVSIYQSQSANPKYCDEIRGLLIRLGADYTEHSYKRKYNGKDVVSTTWRIIGAIATELLSLCPNKTLPLDFLFWDSISLFLLWETLMKGDGNFRDAGRQTFVQKNKILIDQVQALATRLSMPTTLRKRSEGTWSLYKTNHKDRLLRKETGNLISTMKYSGMVWCPKTPYGTFIARKNGRIFVTGNTFPEALIEPMIRAGCPKEICIKCGKPREKIVERGDLINVSHNHQSFYKEKGGKYGNEESYASGYVRGKMIPGWKYEQKFIGLTDCGCKILICKKCGIVLEYNNGTKEVEHYAENVQMQSMPIEIYRQMVLEKGTGFLLKQMQSQMDESNKKREISGQIRWQDKNNEGLYSNMETGSSQSIERICNGTPISNGINDRQISHGKRNSKSQKWNQERQQRGESAIDGKKGTRQTPKAESENTQDNLSTLQESDFNIWEKCPCCGDNLIEQNKWKPGICLDPFAGSGTTMRVAEKLNRVGIGFDLAYEGLQDKRMRFIQKELLEK